MLPLSCALCLPPLIITQRQGLEKLGKGNQAPGMPGPLLTPRARAAQITLHAQIDACDGLNGHLHRKPGRQLLLLLLLLRLATTLRSAS